MPNIPEVNPNPPAPPKFLHAGVLAAVVLFILLTVFVLLRLTPRMSDDFFFARYSGDPTKSWGGGEPMTSLTDVFCNIQRMYMNWDGRAPIAFSTFLFSFLGKNAFDIFQPFLYLGIMLLAYIHVFGHPKIYAVPLLLIFILSYLYSAAFGEAVLWLVGSCYSFECFTCLLFLLPYRLAAESQGNTSQRRPFSEIFLVPFILFMSIYVGWIGANMAAGSLLIVGLFLFFYKKNHIPIRPWMILGIFGLVIGIAVMLASPGNAIRIDQALGNAPQVSFLHRNLIRIAQLITVLETSNAEKLLALFFVVGAIKISFFNSQSISFALPCIYVVGALVAIGSFLASPCSPTLRAIYPANILLIIAFVALGNTLGLDWNLRSNKIVFATFLLVFFGMFFVKYMSDARDCRRIKMVWNERIDIINQALASGQKDVVLPPLPKPSIYRVRLLSTFDICANTDDFVNKGVANYYGLNSVVVANDETLSDTKNPDIPAN